MHLFYDNCNDAFTGLVEGFNNGGMFYDTQADCAESGDERDIHAPVVKNASRNGPVLMIEEPVCVTYKNPWRRVLFNKGRDANPFFHMVEAMWCLAGMNDANHLAYYAPQVLAYADFGSIWRGAYGHRWRSFSTDLLHVGINILRNSPTSRRVVIPMYWPMDLKCATKHDIKDIPCNTQVMLSLRSIASRRGNSDNTRLQLDITVTNRSNDMVWGMLGSNYVTFSFLQEYVACALDADIGRYHQFSNNLHVYTKEGATDSSATNLFDAKRFLEEPRDWYAGDGKYYRPQRMFADLTDFNHDLLLMFSAHPQFAWQHDYKTPFFRGTVQPILETWVHHKRKDYTRAQLAAAAINSTDWKLACQQWLDKRDRNRQRAKDDGPQHEVIT